MARRRWYRRPVRVVAAKKKWATHFAGGPLSAAGETLVNNTPLSATPTPVILKCGNFKIQGDCTISNNNSGSGLVNLTIILAFVPESFSADGGTIMAYHPEWIMGWTTVDTNGAPTSGTNQGSKWSITSRLKRNLNSGDKVMLFYDLSANAGTTATVKYKAQYWTCAN